MIRQYLVAAALLGLAACATSGPEAPGLGAQGESPVITGDSIATEGATEQVDALAVAEAKVDKDKDDLYCRKERLTGTRIAKTVCMKRSEREQLQKVAQSNMEAIRRTPSATPQK
jgi:hypothetical protein